MKKRVICILLSAVLTFSPFCQAVAAPIDTVSGNNIGVIEVEEDNQEQEEPLLSKQQSADDMMTFEGGYVPIADGYVPDKVKENDTAADIEVFAQGVSPLGDAKSEKYVPVDEDFIPKMYENQMSSQMCWAFSQATATEINAKKMGVMDTYEDLALSAVHLAYYFSNLGEDVTDPSGNLADEYTRYKTPLADSDWSAGRGNGRLSMWEAASWNGLVSYFKGTDSAYDFSSMWALHTDASAMEEYFSNDTQSAYLEDDVHVQHVYMAGLDEARRSDTKNLIYNLGAVTTGYYTNEAYDSFLAKAANPDDPAYDYDDGYPVSYGNYYYNGTNLPNHAITLIGWDDTYKKENFVYEPASDGAWLALNSWGDESSAVAGAGLFWISYEDAGLLQEGIAIAYQTEAADNYDNIYQYDGSCDVQSLSGNRFVQFFKTNDSEEIKAVSIGLADANTAFNLSIYKIDGAIGEDDYEDVSWFDDILNDTAIVIGSDGGLLSAELLGKVSEELSYAGYHTIDVSDMSLEPLAAGDLVAVVFDFANPTKIFVDGDASGTHTISDTWNFITAEDAYRGIYEAGGAASAMPAKSSLRIKMFTDDFTDSEPTIEFTSDFDAIEYNTPARITAEARNVAIPDSYYIRFFCPDNEYLSVNETTGHVVTKKAGGPVKVTARLYRNSNDELVATATKDFSVVVTLTGITLPETQSLKLNEEKTLTASPLPENAEISGALWKSSDETIVSVDQTGKITGKKYGTAAITCKAGSVSSNECSVTVAAAYTGIALDKETLDLKKGGSFSLTATILPEGNNDIVELEWSSSDADVACVNNGVVSALGYGTADVTVRIKGTDYSASCKVTVGGQMTGVELNKETTAVMKGKTTQLVATAYPADTTDEVSFTWSSNDPYIAAVDNSGIVTGVNFGEAEITVRCGHIMKKCRVIVTGQVSAVNISPKTMLLKNGATGKVTVSLEPEEVAGSPVVVFTSSNGNVATVSADGTVTAKGEGSCTVTAEYNGMKSTCNIVVDSLKVLDDATGTSSVSLKAGEEKSLTVAWNVQSGDVIPSIRWKSNDPAIATVDTYGIVKGVSKGQTTITVSTTDGIFQKTINVVVTETGTVPDDPAETAKLMVSGGEAIRTMEVGDKRQLSVSYTPKNASVTYTSSDSAVASVSGTGMVTAEAEGTATITVKLVSSVGNDTKSFHVTVKKKDSGIIPPDVPTNPSAYTVTYNTADFKEFEVGETVLLKPVLKDNNGNTVPDVEYVLSSDGIYASVSADDRVTAKKAGTAIIYLSAYIDDKKLCDKTVYISVKPFSGTKPVASGDNTGEKPSDTPSKPATPGDGNTPVVSGKPQADAKPVNIKQDIPKKAYVNKIRLSAQVTQIGFTGTLPIKAEVFPADAENKAVTWTSSNTKWASVDANGVVRAKRTGAGKSVVITCKSNDGSGTVASCSVTISKGAVKKVKISQAGKRKSLNINKKLKLDATLKFDGDKNDAIKKLEWTSSNNEWATVDKNGNVKAYPAGEGHTVTIYARAKDMSGRVGSYKIKIVKSVVTKIKIHASKEIEAGTKLKLKTTVKTSARKEDANTRLKWTTSNKKWATVSKKGVVKAKKAGKGHKVTITAMSTDGTKVKAKVRLKIK